MDLTFKWMITGLYGEDYENTTITDAVRVIHWRCSAMLTDNVSISESRYGFVILDRPFVDDFKEYDDLTEQNLFDWMFTKLNKDIVEQQLRDSLSNAEELHAMGPLKPLPKFWMGEQRIIPTEPPFIPPPDVSPEVTL